MTAEHTQPLILQRRTLASTQFCPMLLGGKVIPEWFAFHGALLLRRAAA